jgi:hypothetical protein
LSGFSRFSAFHMSELFFAQRFVLSFLLTKIGVGGGSASLFGRPLTSVAKARTQKAQQRHSYETLFQVSWFSEALGANRKFCNKRAVIMQKTQRATCVLRR